MKNVIVIRDFPQECGCDLLRFVDCNTGEIIQDYDITNIISSYYDSVYADLECTSKSDIHEMYLVLHHDIQRNKLEFPFISVLDDRYLHIYEDRICGKQDLHEYNRKFNYDWKNFGFISDVPEPTVKDYVTAKQPVYYKIHSAELISHTDDSAEYSCFPKSMAVHTYIYKIRLEQVEIDFERRYHPEKDTFFDDMAKQGIIADDMTYEDRISAHDDKNNVLVEKIARKYGYKVLNVI